MSLVNPFEVNGQWYRANLHTHSTVSDGDTDPVGRVTQYRAQGYQILALTDHWATSDVAPLQSAELLVISGTELHPSCPFGANKYHLVCLNVPADFAVDETWDVNRMIEAVRAAGGEVIVAHPYWCGHNVLHLLPLTNCIAMEVYNATCGRIGKAYSYVQWDDLLDAGRIFPAVAVDDVHRGRDVFMGWTMVKAPELTVEAVMAALRSGCFYASCGPAIEDFRLVDGKVVLSCSEVREIHLISRRSQGWSFYADADGPALTTAEREVGPELGYVRAQVVDAQGRHAWTNPILIEDSH